MSYSLLKLTELYSRYFTNETKLPATVTAKQSYSIWFLG